MPERAATFNLGAGASKYKVVDLKRLTRKGVTVMGLQEAGDRETTLSDFVASSPYWQVYRPDLPGAASVPILWNDNVWKMCRMRTVLAVARRFVGPGAGPRFAKDKQINVVVLKHRTTKERRRFINTHFVASATRRPVERYWRRREHFEEHALVLAGLIQRDLGPRARFPKGHKPPRRSVVMGDFNAQPDFEGLSAIHETGITGWTTEPTHGDRSIDHVLGPEGKRTVVETSSDHKAVLADL